MHIAYTAGAAHVPHYDSRRTTIGATSSSPVSDTA